MIWVLLAALGVIALVWVLEQREPDRTCGCVRPSYCPKCRPEFFASFDAIVRSAEGVMPPKASRDAVADALRLQIDTVRFPVGLQIDTDNLTKAGPPWRLDLPINTQRPEECYKDEQR